MKGKVIDDSESEEDLQIEGEEDDDYDVPNTLTEIF